MKSFEKYIAPESDYYMYTASTIAKKLFFYPICLGYFYYEPGYYIKRNNYNSFLILIIRNGSLQVTINNGTFLANKGEVVLLDCYAPHQYETSKGCECAWIHFDGQMARDYYNHLSSVHGNKIVPRNDKNLFHAFEKTFNIFKNSLTMYEASFSNYITTMLTELLLSGTTEEMAINGTSSLTKTVAYINEHFAEQLSLDDMASQASLSPFYFTRIFTKETGMTPHQYLMATRLNSAKFLLKATTLSIKEIGFKSGFTSESNFCTAFKKWENITPSDYREIDSCE